MFVGVAFILHGTPKIDHPFTWLDGGAFAPPPLLQATAACAEFLGGWALLLGAATRVAAAFIAADMLVAILAVHIPHRTPLASAHGESLELPILYLVLMIGMLVAGAGPYSIDALLTKRFQLCRASARWIRQAN